MKKQKVNIRIESVIDGELTVEEAKADLRQGDQMDVLIYEHEMDQVGLVRNFITIQNHKVNIKRTGQIIMNQQFLLDRITETAYQHPYGNFHIELSTNDIQSSLFDDAKQRGEVMIDYHSQVNGTEKQKHRVTIVYEGE
ncbi:MAG TPA: DUF1934 domain-containing protein [Pseudogracilibacillus sp.]|nr:DUF1934 domain-containing protein [Pseudogracilibacillus sp.]